MLLNNILSEFTKVKGQLTQFVSEQGKRNGQLESELSVGRKEVVQAKAALKQVTKITGK